MRVFLKVLQAAPLIETIDGKPETVRHVIAWGVPAGKKTIPAKKDDDGDVVELAREEVDPEHEHTKQAATISSVQLVLNARGAVADALVPGAVFAIELP